MVYIEKGEIDKEIEKVYENNDIVIRLQNLKETVLEIIDSKYRYALLILLAIIDDCIDKLTIDKLIYLQIVATDLNNLYERYGFNRRSARLYL